MVILTCGSAFVNEMPQSIYKPNVMWYNFIILYKNEEITMKRALSMFLAVLTVASVTVIPATAVMPSYTQEVEATYMSSQPTFDGIIDYYEWGEKSFTVYGADAAKPGDTMPAANNTFAYYGFEYDTVSDEIVSEDEAAKAKITGLTYDVWIRWDIKYLYIATKVNDPDGYYLPAGRERIWNGDCVQFRVDPQGPNGYCKYKNSDYDYRTEGFDVEVAEGVGYMPWAYRTKICNIGLGAVNGDTSNSRNIQAYDMADQGTGNMTKMQLLNDPSKMGPNVNALKDENDYTTLFNMSITDNGDGTSTNCYECAVPWAFIDQWGLGQVAVGYAWGMSMVVLNGYDDGDADTSAYDSFLTWGSGICGAQQDDAFLRPTAGGSNAIVLGDRDAITGETVEGLPQLMDQPEDDGETVPQILDATGMNAYYLGSGEHYSYSGNYELSLDVAYLGMDPINPNRTYVGTWLGDGYSMAAGWDAYTKKFFVAENQFYNGINKDIPYAQSEEEFDWQLGDWHNLTVKVEGRTASIYLDGELVLEDTDKRYACVSTTEGYQIVTYNIGDYVYDNYSITVDGVVLCDYTFDSDDTAFNRSDFKLQAISMSHEIVLGECNNVDPDSNYNCLMRAGVDFEGKPVMRCDFCGYREYSYTKGDANDDGIVTLDDVTLIMRYIAGWDTAVIPYMDAADVTGDGMVTLMDVVLILQYIAKWDVEFH